MRTFVVNLDRNRDRWDFMVRQLAAQGLAFERFPAVDGRALTPEERTRSYSPVRALLDRGFGLRAGEIGCALSHIGIYRRMVDEGLAFVCILEDDATLGPGFAAALREVEQTFDPTRGQVIMLSNGKYLPDSSEKTEFRRLETAMFTDAYVITRPAAAAILRENFPVFRVADAWCRFRQRTDLELYRRHPTVAWQERGCFTTDVAADDPSWSGGLPWKLWRLFGRSADWILWKVTGR